MKMRDYDIPGQRTMEIILPKGHIIPPEGCIILPEGCRRQTCGQPRPSVYGSPQAAGGVLGAGIFARSPPMI